jgi:hypothetical protein
MKLLDRMALNTLIKTISNFILSLIKIFYPTKSDLKPTRKRPLKDLLDKIINK